LPLTESGTSPPSGRLRYGEDFDLNDTANPGTPCSASLPCQDANGHGTMVAGVAAGNAQPGAFTDSGGFFYGTGVAPSAGVFMSKLNANTLANVDVLTTDARITASPPVFIQNHSYNQYSTINDGVNSCDPTNPPTPVRGKI